MVSQLHGVLNRSSPEDFLWVSLGYETFHPPVNIVARHVHVGVSISKKRFCLFVPLVCNLGCQIVFGFKGGDMGSVVLVLDRCLSVLL